MSVFKWTHQATLSVISLRAELDDKFISQKNTNREVLLLFTFINNNIKNSNNNNNNNINNNNNNY